MSQINQTAVLMPYKCIFTHLLAYNFQGQTVIPQTIEMETKIMGPGKMELNDSKIGPSDNSCNL